MEQSKSVMENKILEGITTNICIPAYDMNKNGIMFNFEMEALPSSRFNINADGNVAIGLKRMFDRAIFIMADLNNSWKCLQDLSYTLASNQSQFRVMDARSAGLALCIALMNVVRELNGLKQVQSLTGSGILRIDGTFEKSFLEERKQQATLQMQEWKFIHSDNCKHIFDLAFLMDVK